LQKANAEGAEGMRNTQTIAALGAFRQQTRIDHLIANNLSNVQTAGFKREVPVFNNVLSQAQGRFRPTQNDPVRISFTPGPIQKTGNDLDLAIEGEGFFKVESPNGVRYTQSGNFRLNKDQVLVNANGFPVLGQRGKITLTGNKITVGENGSIAVDGNEADQIAVVSFPDLSVLKKEGHTLLKTESTETEMAAGQSRVVQGALEASNVNAVEEMVNLMDSFRTYESCLKIIQADDSLDSKAVNEVGKV
jgi:flagellar basal-body rod protein FlgG